MQYRIGHLSDDLFLCFECSTRFRSLEVGVQRPLSVQHTFRAVNRAFCLTLLHLQKRGAEKSSCFKSENLIVMTPTQYPSKGTLG